MLTLALEQDLHPPTNHEFYHSFATISGICIWAAIIGSVIWLAISLLYYTKGRISKKRLFKHILIAVAVVIGTFLLAVLIESILESIIPRHIC